MLTDVEISRALNAVSATLRDQRPDSFDVARVQEIVTGALANELKVKARATGPASGQLRGREDDRLLALVELRDGQWTVERKIRAGGSSWALPQPAHDERRAKASPEG